MPEPVYMKKLTFFSQPSRAAFCCQQQSNMEIDKSLRVFSLFAFAITLGLALAFSLVFVVVLIFVFILLSVFESIKVIAIL